MEALHPCWCPVIALVVVAAFLAAVGMLLHDEFTTTETTEVPE